MPAPQDIDIIEFIVQKCIRDGNLYNPNESILHFAAANGDRAVCMELVEAGALVNLLDADGRTPLISAAMHGNLSTCRCLLECGADGDVMDRFGMAALNYAEARQHHELAAVIIAHAEQKALSSDLSNHALRVESHVTTVRRL